MFWEPEDVERVERIYGKKSAKEMILRILPHLLERHVVVFLANNRVCHLPDLEQVIFRCAADKPGVVRVPAEVGQMVGVAAMHEKAISKSVSENAGGGLG